MHRAIATPDLTLGIPDFWDLNLITLHFEGEDLTEDENPFAGSIVISRRLDVPFSEVPEGLIDADLEGLQQSLTGFELVRRGDTDIEGQACPFLEFDFDAEGHRLRQLCITRAVGGKVYGIFGTHVCGERFARVRDQIIAVGHSLQAEP